MDEDKYTAVWISHSSLSDFLTCPRAYYFANIYKNPKSRRKITIVNPFMSLGQVVHSVIEGLSLLPAEERFAKPLAKVFEEEWQKVAGKKGGFSSEQQEKEFKERGLTMLAKIEEEPGPLLRKAVKIKEELPHYWFSKEENIILCGKIDWIEYLEEEKAVHIIDFKTGRRVESDGSLQLPIYYLLASNTQSFPVKKMSYWYLDTENSEDFVEVQLPDEKSAIAEIMQIAMRVKLARKLNHFKCSTDEKNGCMHCAPYEAIVKGHGEFVGVNMYNKEAYILTDEARSL